MEVCALGIGTDAGLLERHLAELSHRIEPSLEPALLSLTQAPVDLVLVDGDALDVDVLAALPLLAAPGRALIVLSEAAPDPIAMLRAAASWLPRSLPPERAKDALIDAGRRAAIQREDATAAAVLDLRLRTHREWARSVKRTLDELMHELKTPIFVVQGFTSNLLDEIEGKLAHAQRQSLERIHAAAKLMGEVVKNAAPRLEPPPLEQEGAPPRRASGKRTRLDLEELAQESLSLFSGQAGSRRIEMRLVAAQPLPQVWGDRSRLLQVMVNLLSNAMRFVPDGGAIRVSISREGEACEVTVCDSGPGIDPALAERLFEAGVSGQGRTGLGLAIAREIAGEHRGTIAAEPHGELGGASFRLRLPIDARARDGRLELLLIDDAVLAGQLLIELRNRHGALVPASRPTDMEVLAAKIVAQSATVVFAGEIGERLGTQTIDLPNDFSVENDG
jgi:signal transduction histidine kinase